MFLNRWGWFRWRTSIKAGDIALLLVGYRTGTVTVRVERRGKALQWRTIGFLKGREEEVFEKVIMCQSEIERMLHVLARGFGLAGFTKCEPDDERKKMGWIAFRLV
ncbi:MAG: hypothetical protein NUW02_03695 [Candidatus Campbellbacteria bacterium]|nr:hypothetical protein [Candidatus Campbellbacteria bacterium]